MLGIFLAYNDGKCEEAIKFYEEVFNVKSKGMMRFKDMPPSEDFKLNEEDKDLISYVDFEVLGSTIMMSDAAHNQQLKVGENFSINFSSFDKDQMKGYFDRMSVGGKVTMPFNETFWSSGYGAVIDKFGVQWSFNTIKNSE